MKRHWLTTLFGFLLATATWAGHDPALGDNKTVHEIAAILQGVAAIGLGATAADANKTNSTNGGK